MDSPLEYGYGNRQTADSRARNMATIITVPHLTKEGGISPKSFRTFSERSSIWFSLLSFLSILVS